MARRILQRIAELVDDVNISSIADNDLLRYDSGTSMWLNISSADDGVIGHWNRSGTTLIPTTSTDAIRIPDILDQEEGLLSINVDERLLLLDDGTTTVVDWQEEQLIDEANGVTSIDWEERHLIDFNSQIVCDWDAQLLNDASGTLRVDWSNGLLNDNTAGTSVDWGNRLLTASDGSSQLDWSSAGTLDFQDNAITTTGTVQGEQITSTDDMDMAGTFTNVMGASDLTGLHLDGVSNPLTTYSDSTVATLERTASGNDAGGSGFDLTALENTVANNTVSTASGGGDVVIRKTLGLNNTVTSASNHTGTPFLILDNLAGLENNVTRTGTMTGAGIYGNAITQIGSDINVANSMGYNNAGGSWTTTTTGLDLLVSDTSTITAATSVIKNIYGLKLSVSSNTEGTSTVYGIYISDAKFADTNWGIYDASGANWALAGDDQSLKFGAAQDAEIYYDGTQLVIDDTATQQINLADNDITTTGDLSVEDATINGDMSFVSAGSGLPYGSLFLHEGAEVITIAVTDTYYKVADLGEGLVNNVTTSASAFNVGAVGVYKIDWQLSCSSAGVNKIYEVDVFINGVEQTDGSSARKFSGVGDLGSMSGTCLCAITNVAHDVDIRIKQTDGGTDDVTIFNANFNIVQIGA